MKRFVKIKRNVRRPKFNFLKLLSCLLVFFFQTAGKRECRTRRWSEKILFSGVYSYRFSTSSKKVIYYPWETSDLIHKRFKDKNDCFSKWEKISPRGEKKKDPNGRKRNGREMCKNGCLSRKGIGARPEMYHVEETVIEHVSADIQHVYWHCLCLFRKSGS